jgi:enoyl-CoA hydratase/carnithine racemase
VAFGPERKTAKRLGNLNIKAERAFMNGPMRLPAAKQLEGVLIEDTACHWEDGDSYLYRLMLRYRGGKGVLICYNNPPVHQVGNPGLDAYLSALEAVSGKRKDLEFVVLYGANDPVHAGGDLKESRTRLKETLRKRAELEAAGASSEEIERLYGWADGRLEKGLALYRMIRDLATSVRVVAVCGGGTRFGGSAEIALMADILVGDSRSAMCFSETQIGLIPGWSGVGRVVAKAGASNAVAMAATAPVVGAADLLEIGIYSEVVEVSEPLPKMRRTNDAAKDKSDYLQALQRNNDITGERLLGCALQLAVLPGNRVPRTGNGARKLLRPEEEVRREVERRADPMNYSGLWGRS